MKAKTLFSILFFGFCFAVIIFGLVYKKNSQFPLDQTFTNNYNTNTNSGYSTPNDYQYIPIATPTLTPDQWKANYLASPPDIGFTNGDCWNNLSSNKFVDSISLGGLELMCQIAYTQYKLEQGTLINNYNQNVTALNYSASQAIADSKKYWGNANELNTIANLFFVGNNLEWPKELTEPCPYGEIRSGIFCLPYQPPQ